MHSAERPLQELLDFSRLLRRLLLFSAGALVVVGVTVAALFGSGQRAERSYLQASTLDRIARTAQALAIDRETGIRGFELTHDQRSLIPELIARRVLPAELDSLRVLTEADSVQAGDVRFIADALERWQSEFAQPAMDGQPGDAAALAGKPLFDRVRAAFDVLLTSNEAAVRHDASRVSALRIVGAALIFAELLAIIAIVEFVFRGPLMRMARTVGQQQGLIEQQTLELELQVVDMQAGSIALAEREETLRKSEERYRFASMATNDAIYDWDVATNTFEWSEGIRELFGYAGEDVGTTIEWIVSLLHPEDSERVMGTFYAIFGKDGGSQWKCDYRLRRKDGGYSPVEGRAHIIRSADGQPQRVIGAITDRTEHRALEGQLRQAQKMEAIGRLAGGIAHDFNNILTVIRMSSEFLLADIPEADAKRQDAQEIMNAAVRASRLTRQLLAFSRHQILNPTVMVLNEIVSGMDGMIRRTLLEHIELSTSLAPDLFKVNADAGQMEQVLLNLVVNAADAMPDGGRLCIRTSNVIVDASFSTSRMDVPPGEYACLTVSDNGSGMDGDTVTKIFEPFFTTKGIGKGTGLGLSTVHGIVTQSEGKISVYSEPKLGTTFKIFLPKADGAPSLIETPIDEEWGGPRTETILLVEDEEATRVVIHRSLARAGYTVIDAQNGVAALSIADAHTGAIDLVLTDSMMPEMGGRELVRRLRERRPELAVLIMSGYTEELMPTTLQGGNQLFIEKPFNIADLLIAVRKAMRMSDELHGAGHRSSP